jgi:hypothetical protein
MPDKHPNTERIGGPGASHENRREPDKSKPHAVQDTKETASSADHKVQNKPWDQTAATQPDLFKSRADAGADSVPVQPKLPEGRGFSDHGDTYKDDDLVHPKDRRQVR